MLFITCRVFLNSQHKSADHMLFMRLRNNSLLIKPRQNRSCHFFLVRTNHFIQTMRYSVIADSEKTKKQCNWRITVGRSRELVPSPPHGGFLSSSRLKPTAIRQATLLKNVQKANAFVSMSVKAHYY